MSTTSIQGVTAPTLVLDPTKKSDPSLRLGLMCPSLQGHVVADLTQRTIKVLNSGYGDTETSFELTDMKAFDPKVKLAKLLSENKITKIQGNANIEEAQVILLPDHSHVDSNHSQNRGEIGNAVRSENTIFLCEGIDSERYEISFEEKERCLPKGLVLARNDEVYGWDCAYFHQEGLKTMHNLASDLDADDIQAVEEALKTKDLSVLLAKAGKLLETASGIQNEQQRTDQHVDIRTQNLSDTILRKLKSANGSRIIVDGGASHLLDPIVLNTLRKHHIKFCAISATKPQSFTNLTEAVKTFKGYYKGKQIE